MSDGPESEDELLEMLTPMPAPPEQFPVELKKIEPNDRELYREALGAIHDLTIEIRTVSGFITGYLMKKYNIKDKAEFNKYFLG